MKKLKKKVLVISGIIVCLIILLCMGVVYNNLNFYKAPLRAVQKTGFAEKKAVLPDGTTLNYGEGGTGSPLLLLHGQGVSWTDYMEVLPELSKRFRIFAVDCHGHGKSGRNPAKYTAEAMGNDFIWFIENVIKEPVIISGHSSGGLLTAWLAANSPANVKGIVLEDPPFFSSEAENAEKSFAWNDSFMTAHNFLNQTAVDYYPLYYLENCVWIKYFGEAGNGIVNYAGDYRNRHDGPLEFFFLPPSITRIFHFLDDYDPHFGDTFYDFSWFKNFDHADTLSRIECPAVIIHNNWSYDENGILLGAMSDEYAQLAHELIKNSRLVHLDSGHDSHAEIPKDFIRVLTDFEGSIR